jgi:hypothetical protein
MPLNLRLDFWVNLSVEESLKSDIYHGYVKL